MFIVKIKLIMKVCIIGNSLTSLALAKALVNRDIFVDVICEKKQKKISQTRTLGISKSNIDYFNKNILNIDQISWKIKKIQIFSENVKNDQIINFENSSSHLFSIIKNQKIFDLLNIELKKNKLFNYKNSFDENEYNLIINCDFKHELTKKFFSKKFEKEYDSVAYTTTIDHIKFSPNDTAIQIFTNKGPLAFLPISDTRTSIVYSFKKDEINDKFNMRNAIKKFNSIYKIKNINEISKFNLKSINLRKYYYKNILAFGELLHKLHPLAGQGFNMSLRDIKELTQIIDNKIELGLPLDKDICKEFQNKTKSGNYIFSTGIDFIYECFNLESKIQSNLVTSAVKLVGKNKLLNRFLKKFADEGIRV